MPPFKLVKSLVLSFSLGAVLSVGSDSALTHQVQQLAVTQAQAVASQAAHALARQLGQWAQSGTEALGKEFAKSSH